MVEEKPSQEIRPEVLKVLRSRTEFGLISFYEQVFPGWKFPNHLMPVAQALCDERIKRLMILVGPGSGKSQLLSVCYPAWALGHDQAQTILGVSASEGLIQGFVQASMEIIEHSPWWKVVFPNVGPDKNAGWSPSRGAYVTGRPHGLPDASYLATGITSKALTGKHGKTLLFDDLHDFENSNTFEQRLRVWERYNSQLIGRQDPMGARFILAGRRWAEDDIYGRIMKQEAESWVIMTLPAERKNSSRLFWDIQLPDGLECCFTENQ